MQIVDILAVSFLVAMVVVIFIQLVVQVGHAPMVILVVVDHALVVILMGNVRHV